MPDRTVSRLRDIVDAIERIEHMLADKTPSILARDRIISAAFERFLEIISEASRALPVELRGSLRFPGEGLPIWATTFATHIIALTTNCCGGCMPMDIWANSRLL